MRGHLNLLAQAFKNLLQNAIDHVADKARQQKNFKGLIEVEILKEGEKALIRILDNGTLDKSSSPMGLGVSVATQILRDHHADIEFSSAKSQLNSVIVSFNPA